MSFEKVSNQKLKEEIEKVEEKIGSLNNLPTTNKDSVVAAISETFQSVSNGKTLVASAITDKGVQTSSDATFTQMASNIQQITTGITPTGSINISANGTYDVTDKAQAIVAVGAGTSLISKNITQNGTYNASSDGADGFSSVTVAVPTGSLNSKCFIETLSSAPATGSWYYFNSADPDIAAHINDLTFVAVIINVTDSTTLTYRTIGGLATNHKLNSYSSTNSYGSYLRTNSSGVTGAVGYGASITDSTTGSSRIMVTSDGRLAMYCSTSYAWTAGTYVAMCGW